MKAVHRAVPYFPILGLILALTLTGCAGPMINIHQGPLPEKVLFDVPYEPNPTGRVCFSASFAMVMRYWGADVSWRDVHDQVGDPPFSRGIFPDWAHPDLREWMETNYGLTFLYRHNTTLNDVRQYLAGGHPVIVLAMLGRERIRDSHNLVVIGYDDITGEVILNDPWREFGPGVRRSYAEFMYLWQRAQYPSECGPPMVSYIVGPMPSN